MRVRKFVTLPVRLPLKLIQKLAPNLKRSRIDGSVVDPSNVTSEILDEKARFRKDSPPPPEECPICQDPVGIPNPEGTIESWTSLHCGHRFGHSCIQTWVQDSLDRDDPQNPHPTCPICRNVARHPGCGHTVCIVPSFEMQWNAWQQYHAAAAEAAYVNLRPLSRQRNRLQRREGHPSRPSFTPPKRMADTVGNCTVCAENWKKKEQEKRIMNMVETDQDVHHHQHDEEVPSISRKNTLPHLRRDTLRGDGEASSSRGDRDIRGRSIICNTSAPRIPTPVPMSPMVGPRRVSTAF